GRRHHPLRGLSVVSIVVTMVVGLVVALFALLTFALLRGLTGRVAEGLGGRKRERPFPDAAGDAGRVAGGSPVETSAVPEPRRPRERSFAEIVEALPIVIGVAAALCVAVPAHAKWLVPMDDKQD